MTDAVALQKAVQALEARLGPVDLLVANAGVGTETSALHFDAAAFANIIQVNLIGVANSAAAVLPGMLARGRGHLVAISSMASYRGLPSLAGYCASKAGVNALMEALRVQVRPRGIWTTTVCPGWIRTPMTGATAQAARSPGMLEVDDAAPPRRARIDPQASAHPSWRFHGAFVARSWPCMQLASRRAAVT